MEGAAGDLRIALARQSGHDGRRWIHEPLRLSVFVEAPADAIDVNLARHATVRDLVRHRWLFRHRIESSDGSIHRRRGDGGWERANATPRPSPSAGEPPRPVDDDVSGES